MSSLATNAPGSIPHPGRFMTRNIGNPPLRAFRVYGAPGSQRSINDGQLQRAAAQLWACVNSCGFHASRGMHAAAGILRVTAVNAQRRVAPRDIGLQARLGWYTRVSLSLRRSGLSSVHRISIRPELRRRSLGSHFNARLSCMA
jgi:hypothetical protein